MEFRRVLFRSLRGSYNEGFRAPTLAQVFVGEISRRSGGVPDPYRVDVTGTPADLGDETRQVVRGGNANLGPEEARQHSFGFVFPPTFMKGFSSLGRASGRERVGKDV